MKCVLLFLLMSLLPGTVMAAERPTIAVLPFGVAKDRSSMRWMGLAMASTLTEKLRRVPEVRMLSPTMVVRELQLAGLDPAQASWTPAVVAGPLGQWLNADLVIIGAMGKIGDRKIADLVLQGQERSEPITGSQLWLAARLVDIHSGETLGRAYVEGREEDVFDLQQELLMRIGEGLTFKESLGLPAVAKPPTIDLQAYEEASLAEQMILALYDTENAKKRERGIKKALKRVEKALKRDASYAGALTYQGTLFALQKRPKLANQSFEAAAILDPAFAAPRYGLVDLALQQEDLIQAGLALNRVIEAVPWDDEAHYLKGTVLRLQGRDDEALASFQKAIDLYAHRAEAFYAAGQLHLKNGQITQAIDMLQQAVNLMPGDVGYQLTLAHAFLSAGDKNRTKSILDQVDPNDNPEYQWIQGKLALENGHIDDAIQHLRQVQHIQPDRVDVLVTLGKIYVQQTLYADAVDVFAAAVSHGVALPEIVSPFGEALEALGQKTEAEDLYRQTLEQKEDLALRLRLVKFLLARQASDEAIQVLKTGVQFHADRGDMHVLLGDLYASKTMVADALRHYERAFVLGIPKTPDMMLKMGDLYLAQNQIDRARSQYRQAIDAGMRSADLYAKLGEIEEQTGDLRAALAAYRQAVKIFPYHAEATAGVERLTLALSPKPEPEPDLASKPRPKPKSMGAADYAYRAKQLYESGDLSSARAAFEKALVGAPQNAQLWNDLGAIYAKLGDLKKAEETLKEANRLAPHAPGHLYNLARLYTDMDRLGDAETACREALLQDADYLPAQRQLARIYMMQGEAGRAVTMYQNALKKTPEDMDLNLGLGNALLAQGNLDGAEQAYLAVQKQMPKASAPAIGLGNASLARKDTTQAIAHYRLAAEQNDPAAFVNLGAIHTARDKTEQAVKAYQKALELASNDRDVLMNLAILHYRTKQYGDALNYCRTLQEHFYSDFDIQRLTGMVAYAAGEYELARSAYQRAVDHNPKDLQVRQGLATTLEALNNPGEAKQHWEQWLLLVGNDPARQKEVLWVTEHIKKLPAL